MSPERDAEVMMGDRGAVRFSRLLLGGSSSSRAPPSEGLSLGCPPSEGPWSVRPAAQRPGLPLRELAATLQEKRAERASRGQQGPRGLSAWEAWGPAHIIHPRKVGPWAGWEALGRLQLWRRSLHTVESRFGVGIQAYFVFLRYLVYMNLLHSLLVLAFILGPAAGKIRASFNGSLSFLHKNASLDILLGTGFLEKSPVFFGFYSFSSSTSPPPLCRTSALMYFTGVVIIFSLSLILLVRRMAVGYRRSWLLGKRRAVNLTLRVLCGWDFTVQDPAAAALKHSSIRNHLKLYLQEQAFSLREAQRTLPQWAGLYTLRASLNLVVVSLLGGAFALIYLSTVWSNEKLHHQDGFWHTLLFQYLPAVTMNLVNLLLPHIFRKISSLEDYSLSTQVNATFMRSVFLKLASLGIFLFFQFKTVTQSVLCWENQFGREMYKLVMLDFMSSILITLLVDLPTRLLKDRSCWLSRLLGKQRFQVPFNVLNLVYNQTVLWVGVFYCPLLPLLGTVKLVTLFYFKKFKVMRCCAPEQRMFRAASSSVLFHLMLLLGLFMAAGTLGLDLTRSRSPPSSCGPFEGGSVLNSMGECVASLPGPVKSGLRYLASGPFVVPLIMAEMLILNYFSVLKRAHRRAVEQLKPLLVMVSADKRFLVLVLGECSADKSDSPAGQPAQPPDPHGPPPDPLMDPHGPHPDPLMDPH